MSKVDTVRTGPWASVVVTHGYPGTDSSAFGEGGGALAAELDPSTAGGAGGPSPNGPRVGIVMPLASVRGGAEQMLLDLCRHKGATGVRLTLAFLETGPLVATVRALGIPAQVIPRGRFRQPGRAVATVMRLARWLRSERVEAVVSWMPVAHLYTAPASLASVGAARTAWFQHGLLDPDHRSLMDRLLATMPAREVWLPSRHTAAAYQRAAPHQAVRVIHPSVDLARFDPGRLPEPREARRRLGLAPSGALVGMVTRLEPWKGCATLVAAAPAILREAPDTRFAVVGGSHFGAPDHPGALREQACALGVADRFLWPGHQPDAPLWMQAMDVVVHASWGEPFGMTVLEAMALGKPLVAAASGGPLESVRDGVDGLLVPPGQPDQLARAVGRLLVHPEERQAFAGRAREGARRFSASAMAAVVGESLRELCR